MDPVEVYVHHLVTRDDHFPPTQERTTKFTLAAAKDPEPEAVRLNLDRMCAQANARVAAFINLRAYKALRDVKNWRNIIRPEHATLMDWVRAEVASIAGRNQ